MGALKIEKVHPLEVGWIRRKNRLQRRSGMPIEPAMLFYPKYYAERAIKLARWATLYFRFALKMFKVDRDPNRMAYMDTAMTPVSDHEEDLELFQSVDAKAYLKQEHRLENARHGVVEDSAAAE